MSAYRVGKELKAYRQKQGMTQHELAKKLGYTAQFVTNWERGVSNPPVKAIPKLCTILKINKDQLIALYMHEKLDRFRAAF